MGDLNIIEVLFSKEMKTNETNKELHKISRWEEETKSNKLKYKTSKRNIFGESIISTSKIFR